MAENSRKNEFFERERIAMMAITTKSSIRVNLCVFFLFFIFTPCVFLYIILVFYKKTIALLKKTQKKWKVRIGTDEYGLVRRCYTLVRSCPLPTVTLRKSGQW